MEHNIALHSEIGLRRLFKRISFIFHPWRLTRDRRYNEDYIFVWQDVTRILVQTSATANKTYFLNIEKMLYYIIRIG